MLEEHGLQENFIENENLKLDRDFSKKLKFPAVNSIYYFLEMYFVSM